MKASLYLKLGTAFVLIVIVSIISGIAATEAIYQNQFRQEYQQQTTNVGYDVIRFYQTTGEESFDAFLRALSQLHPFHMMIYKGDERQYKFNGSTGVLKDPLPKETVEQVERGDVYICSDCLVVGLPFEKDGQRHALFLEPDLAVAESESDDWSFEIVIGLTLLMGSLMMLLVVAITVIRPIRRLTALTEQLAQGKFDVHIATKRTDEVGILARSFNYMAKQLNQLEMMRQNFVSNVSHEIQSPLTSIRGFSIALRDRNFNESDRNKYLGVIINESERLSRLGENLLKLSSLDSEHHPFRPVSYMLDEQIRRVVLAAEPQWKNKKQTIRLELPRTMIDADADLLDQVWHNLLSNSIKFTPEQGSIAIRISYPVEGRVAIEVEDSGIGIEEGQLFSIFERFYKSDISRNRSMQGNGLGLAIVKKIVELHGGTITAASSIGQGAVFTVDMPLKQPGKHPSQ